MAQMPMLKTVRAVAPIAATAYKPQRHASQVDLPYAEVPMNLLLLLLLLLLLFLFLFLFFLLFPLSLSPKNDVYCGKKGQPIIRSRV